MGEPWRCRQCGDVIGVYEPVVSLRDGRAHETSRILDPGIAEQDGDCYHRACYEQLADDDHGGGG